MSTPSSIPFFDELPADEREALREMLRRDPELARAFRRWQDMQAEVAHRLNERVPDRRLLVLCALDAADADADAAAPASAGWLSAAERAELAAARDALDDALSAHPALNDVLRGIRASAADFEEAWAARNQQPSQAERDRRVVRPSRTEETSPASDRPAARRGRPVRRWAWRLVAGAAVLAFAVVAFFVLQREQHRVTVTAAEGARQVELADGSAVRLMQGATLTYADPDAGAVFDRNARLEGSAFFDIAPSDRGFVVQTETARATVLSTSFGVQARAAETVVTLVTGRLSLAPKGAPDALVALEPGQQSRVAQNARPTTPVAVDVTETLRWTDLFVFRDTPAVEAARMLSAHYSVSIAVAPALQAERITGTFEQAQPVRGVLEVIAAALSARVEVVAKGSFRLVPDA